jgi:hypothetical protein
MKPKWLEGERISELALQLAMVSPQRKLGLMNLHREQFELALLWHRQSCKPINVARRLAESVFSGRSSKCLALIAQQKAMLQLAADDSSDNEDILDALFALISALEQFELGPDATPKQKVGLAACHVPAVRSRYASLVRKGDIESVPTGLNLRRATRRRIAGYAMFAMFAGWPGILFFRMAADGAISIGQLVCYLVGSVVVSAWLTRSVFKQVRNDELEVQNVNSRLQPRVTAGKRSDK